MDFNELISDFATRHGVDGLVVNDKATAVEIDGMTVGLINDPASEDDTDDYVMVVVEIGYPPPDAEGPFGDIMLKANYLLGGTGGAILCQNPDTDAYAVMRRYSLRAHDGESFSKALEKLLATAEKWKELLFCMREAEEEKAERDAEEQYDGTSSDSLNNDVFLKV